MRDNGQDPRQYSDPHQQQQQPHQHLQQPDCLLGLILLCRVTSTGERIQGRLPPLWAVCVAPGLDEPASLPTSSHGSASDQLSASDRGRVNLLHPLQLAPERLCVLRRWRTTRSLLCPWVGARCALLLCASVAVRRRGGGMSMGGSMVVGRERPCVFAL